MPFPFVEGKKLIEKEREREPKRKNSTYESFICPYGISFVGLLVYVVPMYTSKRDRFDLSHVLFFDSKAGFFLYSSPGFPGK